MKRILLTTTLILLVSSIALGQTSTKKTDSVADALIAKEKQIADALMKKDAKTFNSLVASDGMLNGSHGRMAVADFTKVMFGPDYTLSNSTVEDPQVVMIDKDAAILTYKSTGTETYQGKTETGTSYATTIWVKRGSEWKAIFHQESMVPPSATSSNQ
jgi:hypothetical protein